MVRPAITSWDLVFAKIHDRHEQQAIYREHHRRIRRVLQSRGIGDEVLEDLVQEVFIVLYRRLPDRDHNVPLTTWIAGIARNAAFSHRRSVARKRAAARAIPEPVPAPGLDEVVAKSQAWLELWRFLDGLPVEQREIFVLVDLHGMRVPEVATLTGVPLNTLYSRIRIVRRRLEDHFGLAREA